MHGPMMQGIDNADPDAAFVLGMIPHHQGAIDMAEIVLKFGKDAQNQHLAREIIPAQRREIGEMREWLSRKHPATVRNGDKPTVQRFKPSRRPRFSGKSPSILAICPTRESCGKLSCRLMSSHAATILNEVKAGNDCP